MNQSKIVSVEWINGISTYKKDIKIIYNYSNFVNLLFFINYHVLAIKN